MSYFGVMILVYFGFLSLKFWQRFPNGIIYPFKYEPSIAIDRQTYLWLLCFYFLIMVLSYAVCCFAEQCRIFFHALFIMSTAEFVEYYYRYNTHWAEIAGIDITVANIRFVTLICIMLYYIARWNRI